MGRRNIFDTEENIYEEQSLVNFEDGYEEEIIDEDFVENENTDDFDYNSYRMHKYDNYSGEITYEIAIVKYEAVIRHYAMEYFGKGADYDDLVQEGLMYLKKLLERCKDKISLDSYIRKSIKGVLGNKAARLRAQASYGNRIPFEAAEQVEIEAVGYDWHERETEMFRRVRNLLTENEMKILSLLYRGYSVRMTAKQRNVSHTAIEKSVARIRMKLMPLKEWLEDKTEFPCVNE